jgi:nitroreductase
MSVITNEALLKQLNWRYAVQKFDPKKKLSEAQWDTLAQVLRLAPSSYGLQPWRFLLVQNQGVRKKLTALSWNQSQIEDCSHLVVFATLKTISENHVRNFVEHTEQERGLPQGKLKKFHEVMTADLVRGERSQIAQHWTQRQAYIAMGSLMTAAALMGIDTCPMEGIDALKYDEVLGIKDTDHATVAVVALGHRSASDPTQSLKKVRFPLDQVIHVIR